MISRHKHLHQNHQIMLHISWLSNPSKTSLLHHCRLEMSCDHTSQLPKVTYYDMGYEELHKISKISYVHYGISD